MSNWIKPRLTGKPEPARPRRRFKVIRINWVWAEGDHEALKWVQEEEPQPEVGFAVEEKPKGWAGNLLKQLFG